MSKSQSENNEDPWQAARLLWDNAAPTFDDAPDHGLRSPIVLRAWTALLKTLLPSVPSTILDIGCGTGSLSVVLASLNHRVTGIDLSPAMIKAANAKAVTQGLDIAFQVMNAAHPDLPHRQFDVIICRHLLWALPEPDQVLQRWAELLKQNGRCILIEGFWHTGAGLHADDVIKMLPPAFTNVKLERLSENADLWGAAVTDERYAIVADRKP